MSLYDDDDMFVPPPPKLAKVAEPSKKEEEFEKPAEPPKTTTTLKSWIFFICCRIYSCHLSPHDGQRVDEIPAGTIPAVQTPGQPTCTGCSFLQLGTQNSFSVETESSF